MLLKFVGLFLVLRFVGADLLKQNLPFARNISEQHANFSGAKLWSNKHERIILWEGFCAKESVINFGFRWSPPEGLYREVTGESLLFRNTEAILRQVWFPKIGKNFVLAYESEILTHCIEEKFDLESYSDECSIEHLSAPMHLPWFSTEKELQSQCSDVQKPRRRPGRSLREMTFVPGTMWCGPHQLARNYKELGPLAKEDRCCRHHDNCVHAVPPFSQKYGYFNYMPFTLSHCGCDERENESRKKRSRRRRELFMIPGTQWCGRGSRASKYTNLGGYFKADSCCRTHDHCPVYIPAFKSRWGIFNWGISSMMHCSCDQRFRTCLKMTMTSSANLIGKIFFNMVQTKCFVLKAQKVCTKWSWWGKKCERYKVHKQAHLRDNVSY